MKPWLWITATLLTASTAAAQPLFLWQATRGDAEVWLLGSVHVGSSEFYPLDDRIEAAFAAADTLACEIDLTDPTVAAKAALLSMQKGSYPAGETLRDHLSAETWEAVSSRLAAAGLPEAAYAQFRPTLASVMLTMLELQAMGLNPDQGIDKHLLTRAHADSLPVVDLETVEGQVEALFSHDTGVEELILTESLSLTGEELQGIFAEMVAAWRGGDVEAMSKLIAEQWLDDPRLTAFHEAILGTRNRQMAQTIDHRAGAGETTWFVVVGAAHLVGEDGLPALLAAAGWQVAQVR